MKRNTFKLLALSFAIASVYSACNGKHQSQVYAPKVEAGRYILTPAASAAAIIHGPAVFGVRSGSPFLYSIPATGESTITFGVENLPKGLSVNAKTGLISGVISEKAHAEYQVILSAENNQGSDTKVFTIKVGNTICLTPPLGWNSWNCWGTTVRQEHVIASAKAMVDKGLKNYGWTYINIDDAWQGTRGGKYNGIQSHETKFPNISAMCDEIHELGLKVGIYSAPWMTTYAGFVGGSSNSKEGDWDESMASKQTKKANQTVGEYHFDAADAAQWADWGIDYLKYDWYQNDNVNTLRMAKALNNCGRDIVYSLSNTANIKNADLYAKVANCFRTAGDLKDRWDEKGGHLNIRQQWLLHRTWMDLGVKSSPGHFPDPDMLVIGNVGTSGAHGDLKPSRLTPDEQYSHVSLWSLWAAPMLIGCPIETLDDFTLNLLTNSEVLDVHQDEKAISASSVMCDIFSEIFVKEMADGSIAVGMFNTSNETRNITTSWDLLQIKGAKQVRDVWRQKNIGEYNDSFTAEVPSHGVVLLRIN